MFGFRLKKQNDFLLDLLGKAIAHIIELQRKLDEMDDYNPGALYCDLACDPSTYISFYDSDNDEQ